MCRKNYSFRIVNDQLKSSLLNTVKLIFTMHQRFQLDNFFTSVFVKNTKTHMHWTAKTAKNCLIIFYRFVWRAIYFVEIKISECTGIPEACWASIVSIQNLIRTAVCDRSNDCISNSELFPTIFFLHNVLYSGQLVGTTTHRPRVIQCKLYQFELI